MESVGGNNYSSGSFPKHVSLDLKMVYADKFVRLPPDREYSPSKIYNIARNVLGDNAKHITSLQWFCKYNILRCIYQDVCEEGAEPLYVNRVSNGYFVRSDRLYCITPSLYENWLTSLNLLIFSSGKIFVNDLVNKPPLHLRIRAFICMFAVPLVSFMGLLVPVRSCYFNSLVGDLDCWMNGFDNRTITRFVPQERKLDRCFAIDLQPYTSLCNGSQSKLLNTVDISLEKHVLLKICDRHVDLFRLGVFCKDKI